MKELALRGQSTQAQKHRKRWPEAMEAMRKHLKARTRWRQRMADEIAFPPPGFTAVLVFDDPTPNTVILRRIVEFPMGCGEVHRPKG